MTAGFYRFRDGELRCAPTAVYLPNAEPLLAAEKKDDSKIAQILLYKEYFSKQFGFDVEKIEVEYFIVKRKIYEHAEYNIPRTQSFKPASGKNKRKQAIENFQAFIKDCFDESGKPQLKSYLKNVGESSCKWCPYKDSPELCDKVVFSI